MTNDQIGKNNFHTSVTKMIKGKVICVNDNEILVRYENTKSVTPGQLCALYLEDGRCIGSGIIKEVRKNDEKLWYLL